MKADDKTKRVDATEFNRRRSELLRELLYGTLDLVIVTYRGKDMIEIKKIKS